MSTEKKAHEVARAIENIAEKLEKVSGMGGFVGAKATEDFTYTHGGKTYYVELIVRTRPPEQDAKKVTEAK